MDGKFLGKIQSVWFGIDIDKGIGLHMEFATQVGNCLWSECPKHADMTGYGKFVADLETLAHNAKIRDFSKLKGVPIEAEFEGNCLKAWRILTEVL